MKKNITTKKNDLVTNKLITKSGSSPLKILILGLVMLVSIVLILKNYQTPGNPIDRPGSQGDSGLYDFKLNTALVKFQSDQEYQKYFTEGQNLARGAYVYNFNQPMVLEDQIAGDLGDLGSPAEGVVRSGPDRISQTNVQVVDIDEPDVVKTDGQEIYLSDDSYYYYGRPGLKPVMEFEADVSRIMPPDYPQANVKLIKAWPLDDLKIDSQINRNGNLLVSGNNLLILGGDGWVYGYDISDKIKPQEKWQIKMENGSVVIHSRLYKDKLYLVVQQYVNDYNPCPYKPLSVNEEMLVIPCVEMYHPIVPMPSDVNLSVMIVNPSSGAVENTTSFLASSWANVMYMSSRAIYLTYNHQVNMLEVMVDFFSTKAADLVPVDLWAKLKRINSYDISQTSKMNEFYSLIDKWTSSLGQDQRLKAQTEMQNRMSDYMSDHKRDVNQTAIVKINTQNLKIEATGQVPGAPLNQFSLDEYDGYLRLAVNIGDVSLAWGGATDESANDIYILDAKLRIKGMLQDLGLGERIYAARFIGDRGYLVTFRQTDPFYVLDLSDPANPQLKGELKIPGYSSYLHPLAENKILGVGMENGQLKLSYFDVSNPANPQEISKYTLAEYGSEALYDHHAFLQDDKHQIFFLPGYKGAYIFSYANDQLNLAQAIEINNVQRALYLNDYLYLVSSDSLVVVDENTWSRVKELDILDNAVRP